MSLSPEEQTFLTNLRARTAPNHENPPTLDEMKRAIVILRGSRKSAQEASAASGAKRASTAKPKPTESAIGDMLADLEGM